MPNAGKSDSGLHSLNTMTIPLSGKAYTPWLYSTSKFKVTKGVVQNMSISNEDVIKLIQDAFPDAEISVDGDGYKYETTVISSEFNGLNTLKRHQAVYAAVDSAITSGDLHALTIHAKTPDEA